jgi:intracellular multiplication protein IcmV
MGSRYGVKDFLKSFVNFPAWMGASGLRRTAGDISTMSRELFTLKHAPVREETFEEAIARFNLSEADLKQRQRAFGRLAALYLFVVFCLGIYVVYLWYNHAILSVFMTLVLMLVASSFAFKEHFWYVQMRQRRLGLTLKQWFLFVVGKTKVGGLRDE